MSEADFVLRSFRSGRPQHENLKARPRRRLSVRVWVVPGIGFAFVPRVLSSANLAKVGTGICDVSLSYSVMVTLKCRVKMDPGKSL